MGNADLPIAPAAAHVKAFCRLGWIENPKRGKGSHIILTKPGHRATLSVPCHGDVRRGTLAKLIQSAGLTNEAFLAAFRR